MNKEKKFKDNIYQVNQNLISKKHYLNKRLSF